MSSSAVILDASAVLAHLLGERGGDEAVAELRNSLISAVNWAEVVERAIVLGAWHDSLRSDVEATGAQIVPVEPAHAQQAGLLREPTRAKGLSLADRICFALALALDLPVLTADRAWAELDLGVEVRLIR